MPPPIELRAKAALEQVLFVMRQALPAPSSFCNGPDLSWTVLMEIIMETCSIAKMFI